MIALAFAYYNYTFSKYKFFDFDKNIFYLKKDIFHPKQKRYTVLIYSSNMQNIKDLVKKLKTDNSILAIDLYQKRFNKEDSIIPVTAGMNTLLKFVQKFNIYEVPSYFDIVSVKKGLYKQYSSIKKFD
ncbi:MAG: hypothetical protein DSZ06_01910 [Sulfurospirillum sp.]|nr:MAG: hypothetical protein DSZ06_01910 [Sulfurospirillum sp.]